MSEQIFLHVGDFEIDGDDYFPVIRPVFYSASIYDGPEKYESNLRAFSKQQRLSLAYHWYLSEVNNGGHDQFYSNSTGIVWPDAFEAFSAIDLPYVSRITGFSDRRFSELPSLDHDERWKQMEKDEPDFEDLDNQLFDFAKSDEIDRKAIDFIRANRSNFYFEGFINKG